MNDGANKEFDHPFKLLVENESDDSITAKTLFA